MPPTSTSGFGVVWVMAPSLLPNPAARIKGVMGSSVWVMWIRMFNLFLYNHTKLFDPRRNAGPFVLGRFILEETS